MTIRDNKLAATKMRQMVRFYASGTFATHDSYLWYNCLMSPLSATWHKHAPFNENIPAKETLLEYCKTNAIINPETEFFELNVIRNNNLRAQEKMKLLLQHNRESTSTNDSSV
ncbi:MAG TPA: hypothetical protein EYO73_06260 [Sulfurimonas sp.]|nr:hypothetical protein [Sulfurimonas sp.]